MFRATYVQCQVGGGLYDLEVPAYREGEVLMGGIIMGGWGVTCVTRVQKGFFKKGRDPQEGFNRLFALGVPVAWHGMAWHGPWHVHVFLRSQNALKEAPLGTGKGAKTHEI